MGEKSHHLLQGQMPRVKLWLVLAATLAFSVVLLAAAHLTHSLTLRVEAYHALYNVLSLIGCLLTMKMSCGPQSLLNTFGWARLEVVSMLTTLLFLTSLCFSVAVESIQTAVHAGHQDAMHHPLSMTALGGVGLMLNAVVFCLIGGYTHHQGCFLEMRDSGSVWVGRQVTQEDVQTGRRMLSSRNDKSGTDAAPHRARQVIKEVLRDNCGLVLVEVCAIVVYWNNGGTLALYIDPALAVTSAALLTWLSYPYGWECCHILLQTIPGHINVEQFQTRILGQFPAIINVHHLHIWTFTPDKVVATAHVVFSSPRVYLSTKTALRQFFLDEGVTQVTLQPEFMTRQRGGTSADNTFCLLRCQNQQCHERECCHSCYHHPLLSAVTIQGGAVCGSGEGKFGSHEGVCGSGEGALVSGSQVNVCGLGKFVHGSGEHVCGSGERMCGSGKRECGAEHVCGSGGHVCGLGEHVSGSGKHVCGSGKHVCGLGEHVCGLGEHVCGSGEHVCGSGEHVCGSGEHICGLGEHVCGSGEHVCGSGEHICGLGEHVCGSGEHVCGLGEHVCGSGEHVCGSGESVPEAGEGVCEAGEDVLGSGEGECGSGESLFGLREGMCGTNEEVCGSEGSMYGLGGSLCESGEGVYGLGDTECPTSTSPGLPDSLQEQQRNTTREGSSSQAPVMASQHPDKEHLLADRE